MLKPASSQDNLQDWVNKILDQDESLYGFDLTLSLQVIPLLISEILNRPNDKLGPDQIKRLRNFLTLLPENHFRHFWIILNDLSYRHLFFKSLKESCYSDKNFQKIIDKALKNVWI